MIQTKLQPKNLLSFGLSIAMIGSVYMLVLAANGALTRSGWSGAQNYISQIKLIILCYLVWLGVYFCIRSWITVRSAFFLALILFYEL